MKLENVWMLLPDRKVGFGTIETEGDAISSVSLRDPGESVRLVLPGLVNCHCHAPMTLLRGVGGGLPLKRWLEEAIFPREAKLTDEDVHAGALWGAMEMLAGGTTTVADMYEWNYQHAFLEAGMRARVTTVGRLGAPGRLAECIEATRSWNKWMRDEVRGDVYMDICIHSEYLTDEHFCRELAVANKEFGRRLHVHVSETRREHEECVARHGKTPIAYLAETGLLDCGGYAAHCVWCTDDDFRIMAERDVSLVHNPTSNMKLGSGFARIVRAIELGVNVALGTDGTASNDNLDMFEEMHLASLIHKGIANDPTVLSPWDVIEMATKNGAKALGRGDIGEIAVGKKADFCIVDLDRLHLLPAHDLANLVVHSMHSGDVVQTVVGGRTVYDASLGDDAFDGCQVSRAEAKEALLAAAARLMD
jgi:5-methylthioadenosine/S-adenosylhomocysteine deaminase